MTEEQAQILRDTESRGSLIHGHPDLKNITKESRRDPRFQPIRFHNPGREQDPKNWRTNKGELPTGYGITAEMIEEWKRNQ